MNTSEPRIGSGNARSDQKIFGMKSRFTRHLLLGTTLLLLAGSLLFAQRRFRFPPPSSDAPRWKNAPGFEKDVFTFVRIRYSNRERGGYRRWGVVITGASIIPMPI